MAVLNDLLNEAYNTEIGKCVLVATLFQFVLH